MSSEACCGSPFRPPWPINGWFSFFWHANAQLKLIDSLPEWRLGTPPLTKGRCCSDAFKSPRNLRREFTCTCTSGSLAPARHLRLPDLTCECRVRSITYDHTVQLQARARHRGGSLAPQCSYKQGEGGLWRLNAIFPYVGSKKAKSGLLSQGSCGRSLGPPWRSTAASALSICLAC